MKFWELVSACRDERHLLDRLTDRPEWTEFHRWTVDFDRLVDTQDRATLDYELPDAACRHVLCGSRRSFYLSGGYLRIAPHGSTEHVLSAVDAFDRYGGRALEDVQEYGSVRVTES